MNPFELDSKEYRIFDILPNEYQKMFQEKTSTELKKELFETAINLEEDLSAVIIIDLLGLIGESLMGKQPNLFNSDSSHTSILILISTTMKLKEIYENNLQQKLS